MHESPAVALARRTFYFLGSAALVVAALYLGQRLLVPFALAALLSFVLAPVVSRLERWGLKRVPAVLLVVCFAFLLLTAAGWAVVGQVTHLVDDLPRHKDAARQKVAQLQGSARGGVLEKLQDFLGEVEKASQPAASSAATVVRVQREEPTLFARLGEVVLHSLNILAPALGVLFLVISVLIYREDLRDRVIRLAGRGRLTLTTRALDEAAQRIGRYLLRHSLVNAGFGAALGLGLALLEVPYPALWGMLAFALRFVPSVGVWLVAPFPVALACLSSPGLTQPGLAFGLFAVLVVVFAGVIEPRVCGPSVGVAPVPLVLAVLFWTGLWGMVGLVLATPLTVCLAVLGKHVPQLGFLAIMLGSEPALRPPARYYQRLLARDRHEAATIVREYLEAHPVDRLYDEVLAPALGLVRRGRKRGELRPDDEQFILQATREVLASLDGGGASAPPPSDGDRVIVLGVPGSDEVEEVMLLMLRNLVRTAGLDILVTSGGLSAGLGSLVQQKQPAVVFVASLAPGGLTQARYLCRRLRSQFPAIPIGVGRLGPRQGTEKARKFLLAAGAAWVATTLREAASQLAHITRTPAHFQKAT
jgi:predicted PurR-regulated permease PerM